MEIDMTRLERKFYNPSVTEYSGLFHRPLRACLLSKDGDLNKHASQFGIDLIESIQEAEDFDITFTVDEPIENAHSKYRIICFPSPKQDLESGFKLRPV